MEEKDTREKLMEELDKKSTVRDKLRFLTELALEEDTDVVDKEEE